MKKKIILLIISMMLLVGKVDAATLTQKLGDEYISTTIEAGKTVNMEFTSKLGFQFTKWTVEEGSISIDETDPTISFTMPSSNVTIRGNYDSTYIIKFNANGGEGAMGNQTIAAGGSKKLTKNTLTKAGNLFKGWAITSDGEVEYQDEEEITLNGNIELYAVWEEETTVETIPLSQIAVGAYIEYNPAHYKNGEKITTVKVLGTDAGVLQSDNVTGTDQTFNIDPEAGGYNKGWKVLYNYGNQLTLISAESVGNLTLGTDASASNDETNAKLNGGKIGYAKAIYTLNKMCAEYAKGEFAESGRCLGYNGSAVENILEYTKDADGNGIKDADLDGDGDVDIDDITNANMSTLLGSTTGSDIIKEPWGDSYNSADVAVLEELGDLDGGGDDWWLASRRLYSYGDSSYFGVRSLDSDGNVYYNYLYRRISRGGADSDAPSGGVRPVIILESGLKIIKDENDGSTVEKAYKLTR